MNEQMKKAVYEAPLTERFQIELEGVFCASVEFSSEQNVTIDGQTINENLDNFSDNNFSAVGWN